MKASEKTKRQEQLEYQQFKEADVERRDWEEERTIQREKRREELRRRREEEQGEDLKRYEEELVNLPDKEKVQKCDKRRRQLILRREE